MKGGLLLLVCFAVASALYSPSDDVIELTAANFNSKVIQSDDLWLVEFYAPWCGHCKNLAPDWKKAAKALKGIVKIGAVDMDQHSSVGGPYNVRGFPTIKVFGTNKNSPSDYQGARSAQGIVDGAMTQLKNIVSARLGGGGGGRQSGGGGGGEDVITLTDSNFDKLVLQSEDLWLVEFYAPWCGHCKSLAPVWESVGSELKGKVKVGKYDADSEKVFGSRFGIQGFPTIKVFAQGKKDGEAIEYNGGRTKEDFVNFAIDKLAADIPPPEPKQIVSEESFNKECDGKPLCVMAFLPHILDCQSECRNKYLQTLVETAVQFKKNAWGWTWAEAGSQFDLEQAVGIGGFGYPAMAVMNPKKGIYALLMGSFSESGIKEFLRSISFGRGRTSPLPGSKVPKIVKSDVWDGKDGVMPVEEDEDDKKEEL